MSARRVPVNVAALLVGRVVGAAVSVIVLSLAAHRLDGDDFGVVVSTMAAGFMANSLVTFGTDTVVTRAVAAERSDSASVTLASLRLQLGAALLLAALSGGAVGLGADVAVLVQGVALVPLAVVTVGGAVLRGRQRMDQLLVSIAVGAAATLAIAGMLFSNYQAPWVPIAALAVGSATTAALMVIFASPRIDSRSSTASTVTISSLARETAPFAAMVVLAAVGAQAGPLIVEFASDETAGGYGVAVRVSEAARLLPAAAMGAFFPAMLTGLHRTERYVRWIRWVLVYAVVATVGLLLLADPINRIVFDAEQGGAPLIRILAAGLVATVVRLARSFELIAGGHERTVLASALLGAAVTVGGGLVVAPTFGAQGVAWAQLAGLVVATGLLVARRPAELSSHAPPPV